MSENHPVYQRGRPSEITKGDATQVHPPQNSLSVCSKISEVRTQMAEFSKRLDDFKERSRLAREEVIKDYNEAVEKELKMVEEIMKSKETSIEKQKARWAEKYKNRKECHMDESVMRKHFEDMGIIVEEEYTQDPNMMLNREELEKRIFGDNVEATEENEVLGNICEENTPCGQLESTEQSYSSEETMPAPEEIKTIDNAEEEDEDGIVLIDTDSYEEYLTTNEDEETEEMYVNTEFEMPVQLLECQSSYWGDLSNSTREKLLDYPAENVLEKSGESYEDYFTTNEEDYEEYNERTDVKYEELDNVTVAEGFGLGAYVGLAKTMEEDKEKASECNSFEDNDEERLEDAEDVGECEEKPIIKRNITCSLEMQLAKKSD